MKALLPTFLVLCGFGATNALANAFLAARPELRLPLGSPEREKIEEYRRNAEDYDLVFVGTSRVLRGFDPRAFEAGAAELGRPLASFNFGLVSMGFLEEAHLVDWILARGAGHLRWLLIEPTERDAVMRLVGKDAHKLNLFTMRSVYWHGWRETRLGLNATWRSPRKLGKKLELTRLHLLHLAHRLCNVGVGSNGINLALWSGPRETSLVHGFSPRDPEGPEWEEVDERGPRGAPAAEPSALVLELLADMAARARAAGVEPLFVLPPTPSPPALSRHLDLHPEWRAPAEILHYSSTTFPEILRAKDEHFYDEGHMNLRGAALFSTRLARDFVAWLAAQDGG